MIKEKLDFNKSIKNLVEEEYKPKEKVGIEEQKRVVSILNEIRNNLLDHYLDPNTIFELHNNYQHNKVDSILKKSLQDKTEMYRNTKNSLPEETIAERVKLIPQKKRTGIKILIPNKVLTRNKY